MPRKRSKLEVAWQVLGAEGGAAFRDRLLDRLAAWRRRRRFRLVEDGGYAPERPAPILNVLPTPPRPDLGGVQVQFLRRFEAEAKERPCAVLYPDRGGYRLEVRAGQDSVAMALPAPDLASPLEARDPGFEHAIRQAVRQVGARAVHVEQPLGLPLESLIRLAREELPLVLSLHDFGLFCLRPHLLERPSLRFCQFCRDDRLCTACLRQDWDVDEAFQPTRRAVSAELLRMADAVIYPSEFLRRSYQALMPEIELSKQWVVELGSSGAAIPARDGFGSQVRHVAFVGSVKAHKGAILFEELIHRFPRERFPNLRWSAYGGGDTEILKRWRRQRRVRVRGYYCAGTLPRLLLKDLVDLALLLSIVPESYGLTLDECRQAGVPVIAFDHGAVAERIRRVGGGLLAIPESGVEGIVHCLEEALAKKPPAGSAPHTSPPPDVRGLARSHGQIYRQLGILGRRE